MIRKQNIKVEYVVLQIQKSKSGESEWKHSKLRDVGVQLIDCVHKTPPAVSNGLPYIGIPQMKSGCIDFSANPRLISREHLKEWNVKAKPTQDDIILSRRCNPGETVYVPEGVEFALGQNLVLLRASGETVYPPFLRWLVRGPEWWAEIGKYLNVGAVFDSLRCADIPDFELPIPPLPEQKAIAHILGSLDDKIELNRRMNATLEGMAQALFKSWFVDFDPVLDNALAAGNPIPEELAERAEVRRKALSDGTANREAAKQFPAAFQLTEEMGWIPEGWEVRAIDDFADVKHGFAFKGEYFCDEKTKDILVTPGNFQIGGGFKGSKLKYYSGPVDDNYVFDHQDLIVTMTDLSKAGDTLGFPAFIPKSSSFRYLHNQRIGRVDLIDPRIGKFYLNQVFRSESYRNEILGNMTGSTVKHTSPSKILAFSFPFSGGKLEGEIDSECEAFESKISQNHEENITLTKLRDTLLPKLTSGELRIPEAEKLATEAL